MKIKPGIAIKLEGLTEKDQQRFIDVCIQHGAKRGRDVGGTFNFLVFGDSSLEVYKSVTDQGMELVTFSDTGIADDKPHFDFSRTPNSEKAERALQENLSHIKMMTEHGKSRYIHCCYTEEDAKNVVAHFHANPQFTKELHIKSYEQSGSDVYIFYKKRTADDWHERGDLPPVGTECEYSTLCNGQGFEWCRIVHNSKCASWIVTKSDDKIIRNDLVIFRPLKTERERAIESAINDLGCDIETAAAMYDQGYRKGEK